MSALILVDSSVWIEAGRPGGDAALSSRLAELLHAGSTAMSEPIWVELYQGIRSKREEARLEMARDLCTWLPFDTDCWKLAAISGRACLRSGVNVPFGDLLVHACAHRHGVQLLEKDRHFAMITSAIKTEKQ